MFVLGYAFLIAYSPQLQVIDDHGLLNTLMVGGYFDGYLSENLFKIGRFYPLNMQEFNLISYLFGVHDVKYFYYLIAIEFCLVPLLFLLIFREAGINKKYLILTFIMLALTPGFVTGFFRMHIGERSVLLFITLFLYCFLSFHKEHKLIYAVFGIFFANVALYYKEPVFLLLGSFAFFHLLFSWNQLNLKQKIFDLLLILSSLTFLIVYFTLVFRHIGDHIYGLTTINPILVMAKNIFNGSLGDPLIVFVLIPLFFWRIYLIVNKMSNVNPLFDSLLFSSVIYVLVFVKLNMYAYHYLLPVYIFAIPAILYFFINEMLYKRKAFRLFASLAFLVTVFSSLPTSIHLISYYKNVPHNFQKTLTFLVGYIEKESSSGKKVTLFIDGVNKGSGVEVYISFIKYLEFRQIDTSKFKIKATEVDDGLIAFAQVDNKSPYEVFSQSRPSQIHKGDLLIISPYSNRYVGLNKDEIKVMLDKYDVIFHADSFMEVPDLGVKSILKYCFMRATFSSKNDKAMISQNVFQLPLDFYVLKKN